MKKFLFLLLFLFICCHKNSKPRQTVLAEIGDRTITVDDFRKNYEFGLPNLKTGSNRKLTYLNYMINEKVLALEGYRLGLQNSSRVKRLEKDLTNELLVEALFDAEVKSKITVTPQEIEEAISKAKVSWKLRYWYEPNAEFAGRVRNAMQQQGYAAVLNDILNNNPEVQMQAKDFETGYLTYLDVPEELLSAIQNLPIGELSQPVEMNGGYYIFQVADIRRQGVTDYEFKDRFESYRQILFYRKLNKAAVAYVAQTMIPKNVTTKNEPFRLLSSAINAWGEKKAPERGDFLQAVRGARPGDGALYDLSSRLPQNLVTFSDGKWTIEEFLSRFNPAVLKKSFGDLSRLRPALNEEIAVQVRNYFFIKAAKEKKLDHLPSVQDELSEWRDKWVFEESRRYYGRIAPIDDQQLSDYFSRNKSGYRMRRDDKAFLNENLDRIKRDALHEKIVGRLQQVVDSLQVVYPVVIHHNVLDTIQTIDLKGSRWAGMQVYKQSSKRLAVPIVDPGWGKIKGQ